MKDNKVEGRESTTSPKPSIQTTQRKSRNEQANFRLASSSTDGPHKRKKNWRSPSNPIEFMNCVRRRDDRLDSERDDNKLMSSITTFSPITAVVAPSLQKQLNFDFDLNSNRNRTNSSLSKLCESEITARRTTETGKMTVISSSSKPPTASTESKPLLPYEISLIRAPRDTSKHFVMLAELSISPIVSTGSSDYTSTKRYVFAFESSYCRTDLPSEASTSFDSTSLAHGHIDPIRSEEIFASHPNISNTSASASKKKLTVSFSRCSLLQVILRNPEDNSVAGIFVVKIDLTDMPTDSRTILRQKAYKSKCLSDIDGENVRVGGDKHITDSAPDYLAKFLEIPLKRTYDSDANRQRITLSGPMRVAYSFNRSNLRFTTPRRSDASAVEPVQKTRTVLQFPSQHQKYFPVHPEEDTRRIRSNSLNSSDSNNTSTSTRSFQHGSLCL